MHFEAVIVYLRFVYAKRRGRLFSNCSDASLVSDLDYVRVKTGVTTAHVYVSQRIFVCAILITKNSIVSTVK